MKVEILKDVTLTVKAGQIVDIDISSVPAALRMGFIAIPAEKEPEPEEAPKKKRKK